MCSESYIGTHQIMYQQMVIEWSHAYTPAPRFPVGGLAKNEQSDSSSTVVPYRMGSRCYGLLWQIGLICSDQRQGVVGLVCWLLMYFTD